jgi:hypothetical protein
MVRVDKFVIVNTVFGSMAAIVAAVASIVAALRSLKNGDHIQRLQIEMDGRLTELLATARSAGYAEGQKNPKPPPVTHTGRF